MSLHQKTEGIEPERQANYRGFATEMTWSFRATPPVHRFDSQRHHQKQIAGKMLFSARFEFTGCRRFAVRYSRKIRDFHFPWK